MPTLMLAVLQCYQDAHFHVSDSPIPSIVAIL